MAVCPQNSYVEILTLKVIHYYYEVVRERGLCEVIRS